MDSRLVAGKLLAIPAQPLPVFGFGLRDSLKLALISIMALLSLPFLFMGNEEYAKVTPVINRMAPKDFRIRTASGIFFCRNYSDFFILWPGYEAELREFLNLK